MKKNLFTNSMNLAKTIAVQKIKSGDIVIDATMGNGNDTLFLAKLVGENGKVYSFDIQQIALENTKKKLLENEIHKRVRLIKDGHENMDFYIKEELKLVMFNLGYLPNSDHKITTKSETTIIAIKKALNLLKKNGVVLIVIYHGHEKGKFERKAIEELTLSLNQKEYNVVKLEFTNQINNPPILMIIEKR